MSEKYVYYFGKLKAEGDAKMKNLLGGKGANLSEMVKIGIPVPPWFHYSTSMQVLHDHGKTYPVTLEKDVQEAVNATGGGNRKRIRICRDTLLAL